MQRTTTMANQQQQQQSGMLLAFRMGGCCKCSVQEGWVGVKQQTANSKSSRSWQGGVPPCLALHRHGGGCHKVGIRPSGGRCACAALPNVGRAGCKECRTKVMDMIRLHFARTCARRQLNVSSMPHHRMAHGKGRAGRETVWFIAPARGHGSLLFIHGKIRVLRTRPDGSPKFPRMLQSHRKLSNKICRSAGDNLADRLQQARAD